MYRGIFINILLGRVFICHGTFIKSVIVVDVMQLLNFKIENSL